MNTFEAAQSVYRPAGWPTFPIAPGTKDVIPTGVTGKAGIDLSGADVAELLEHSRAWVRFRGTTQTGLRMLPTTLGIDVDAYQPKRGAETLTEAERRWGPLPNGPWSSARHDGLSGIRLFRVSEGVRLPSEVRFDELGISDIELIRRTHRYAVVWPSIHPGTGEQYTWRGTTGPSVPPRVDDLPHLPDGWLAGLMEMAEATSTAKVRDGLPDGEPSPVTPGKADHLIDKWTRTLHGLQPTGGAFRSAVWTLASMVARREFANGGTEASVREAVEQVFAEHPMRLRPDEKDRRWIDEGIARARAEPWVFVERDFTDLVGPEKLAPRSLADITDRTSPAFTRKEQSR